MSAAVETRAPFDLDALEAAIEHGPSSAAEARRAALAAFRARGLPGPRDEAWRFTSLAQVARATFAHPSHADPATLAAVERRIDAALPAHPGPRVVLVDGWLAPALSRLDVGPGGKLEGLADALARDPALAALLAPLDADRPFAALNLAALQDGAVLRVDAGAAVREPIVVVHVTTGRGPAPLAAHPRLVLVLERTSQATVIEVSLPLEPQASATPRALLNAVTDATVKDGARLVHVLAQLEDDAAVRLHAVLARVSRDAGFTSHTVTLGGRLVRNDLRVLLDGPGAETRLRGLYLAGEGQHVDDHVFIDHARPHGTSDQVFKGVASGNGHVVFDGHVHVREDAQKTSAQQTNRNLLLSERATANANPRLTIHADDVKCSHGATTGQLDADALFYLRARGLDEAVARGVLTVAFAAEALADLPEAARAWLEGLARARLAPAVRGEA